MLVYMPGLFLVCIASWKLVCAAFPIGGEKNIGKIVRNVVFGLFCGLDGELAGRTTLWHGL